MKTTKQMLKTFRCFSLVLLVGMFLTGCATSGRRVLLKEYGPTVPQRVDSPLKGITVSIEPFGEHFGINDQPPGKNSVEPASYSFLKMTPEQEKQWSRDVAARKKSSDEKDWKQIGYVRNLYGIVMSKVYAVNPSGQWLADTLKMDLRQQGATVVEGADSAKATVRLKGSIRYFKIDIYMKYWADLVVDVQIQARDKPPVERTLHTSAGQTAWSGSSFEYFQTIRECQQKLSLALLNELENVLKN